jgi:hypothetical protein
MTYNSIPQTFTHFESFRSILAQVSRGDKEHYLRAGAATNLPYFLRLLNYYLLINNIAIYTPATARITRATDLRYYFNDLTYKTKPYTEETPEYERHLLYNAAEINTLNLKQVTAIHLIEVVGQINETFETAIPEWARSLEDTTEQLGVSLALKLTPKHRIRVYVRGAHVIVFTTKGLNDAHENDFVLYRKLWACLPLLRNWTAEEDTDCRNLCKLLAISDSTNFWSLLEECYSNNPILKDIKYAAIFKTFDNLSTLRVTALEREISNHNSSAERLLAEYTRVLENKRKTLRHLLELQQMDQGFEKDTIKMLVDKHICYALDVSRITDGDQTILYRCSSPLLSYDKDAAQMVYNKRVLGKYNDKMEKLFKLIFIDEKVVLVFDQAIRIKLVPGTINAQLNNNLDNCFPNPHHYRYNCWGSYGPVITKLIHEYKLVELFYQIKAAIGSINFTDHPVISSFLGMFYDIVENIYNPNCFYWKDEGCTTLHSCEETLNHFKTEDAE